MATNWEELDYNQLMQAVEADPEYRRASSRERADFLRLFARKIARSPRHGGSPEAARRFTIERLGSELQRQDARVARDRAALDAAMEPDIPLVPDRAIRRGFEAVGRALPYLGGGNIDTFNEAATEAQQNSIGGLAYRRFVQGEQVELPSVPSLGAFAGDIGSAYDQVFKDILAGRTSGMGAGLAAAAGGTLGGMADPATFAAGAVGGAIGSRLAGAAVSRAAARAASAGTQAGALAADLGAAAAPLAQMAGGAIGGGAGPSALAAGIAGRAPTMAELAIGAATGIGSGPTPTRGQFGRHSAMAQFPDGFGPAIPDAPPTLALPAPGETTPWAGARPGVGVGPEYRAMGGNPLARPGEVVPLGPIPDAPTAPAPQATGYVSPVRPPGVEVTPFQPATRILTGEAAFNPPTVQRPGPSATPFQPAQGIQAFTPPSVPRSEVTVPRPMLMLPAPAELIPPNPALSEAVARRGVGSGPEFRQLGGNPMARPGEVIPLGPVRPRVREAAPQAQAQQLPAQRTLTPSPLGIVLDGDAGRPPVRGDMVDLASLKTDPERFQFKGGGDERGVLRDGPLARADEWVPDAVAANQVAVFEALDGTRFVADGHQRAGLARRLTEQGKAVPKAPALILREGDGWTPDAAMSWASRNNILQGTGSAVDVARLIRQGKLDPERLGGAGGRDAVRDGRGIAALSDEAFDMVARGEASPMDAGLIGRFVTDAADQPAAMRALAQSEGTSYRAKEMTAKMIAGMGFSRSVELSLFGEVNKSNPMFAHSGAILDEATKSLRQQKRGIGFAAQNADALASEAKTKVNTKAASKAARIRQDADAIAGDLFASVPAYRNELRTLTWAVQMGKMTRAEAAGRAQRMLLAQTEALDKAGMVTAADKLNAIASGIKEKDTAQIKRYQNKEVEQALSEHDQKSEAAFVEKSLEIDPKKMDEAASEIENPQERLGAIQQAFAFLSDESGSATTNHLALIAKAALAGAARIIGGAASSASVLATMIRRLGHERGSIAAMLTSRLVEDGSFSPAKAMDLARIGLGSLNDFAGAPVAATRAALAAPGRVVGQGSKAAWVGLLRLAAPKASRVSALQSRIQARFDLGGKMRSGAQAAAERLGARLNSDKPERLAWALTHWREAKARGTGDFGRDAAISIGLSNFGVPLPVIEAWRLSMGEAARRANAMRREALTLTKGLDLEQRARLGDLMTEFGPEERQAVATLSGTDDALLAGIANKLADLVDQNANELVRVGGISEEAAKRWASQYLPRIYRDKVKVEDFANMLKNTMSFVKGLEPVYGRGILKEMSYKKFVELLDSGESWEHVSYEGSKKARAAALDKAISEATDPVMKDKLSEQFLDLLESGDVKIKAWRDYTYKERLDMHEVKDVALRLSEYSAKLEANLARGNFFKWVSEGSDDRGAFAIDPASFLPTKEELRAMSADEREAARAEARLHVEALTGDGGDYIMITGATAGGKTGTAKKFGALSGKLVRRDIARYIGQAGMGNSPWAILARGSTVAKSMLGVNTWKKLVTLWNPRYYVNNFVMNAPVLEAAGGSVFDLPDALLQMSEGSPLVQKCIDQGIIKHDALRRELSGALEADFGVLWDAKPSRQYSGALGQLLDAKNGIEGLGMRVSQFSDDTYRVAYIMARMREGVDFETAAAEAVDAFYTPSEVISPASKILSVVLPFIGATLWSAERLPELLIKNPGKFLYVVSAVTGIFAGLSALAGESPESLAAKDLLVPAQVAENLNPGGAVPGSSWMPLGKDSYGNQLILSTRNWNPGNFADTGDTAALPGWPRALQPSGPVGIGMNILSNTDPFRGRPIVSDWQKATPGGRWAPTAEYLAQSLTPGFYRAGARLANAAMGRSDGSGRTYDLPTAAASVFLPVQPMDWGQAIQGRFNRFEGQRQDAERAAQAALRRGMRSPSLMGEAVKDATEIMQSEQEIKQIQQGFMKRAVKALER